jgi:integrase
MARRAKGEGAVRERANGTWEGRVPVGKRSGRTIYRTLYARSKADLVAKMKPLAGTRSTKASLFTAFAEEWLEAQRERVALATYKTWRIMVRRHLIPALGQLELGSIRPSDVERALVPRSILDRVTYDERDDDGNAKMRQRGAATFSKAKSVAFSIFERARANGLTLTNPVESVRLERRQREHKAVRSLDEQELRRFNKASKSHLWRPYFDLALATGARPSELLALEWGDVDFDDNSVRFTASLGRLEEGGKLTRKAMKTPESRRLVDVPSTSLDTLRMRWENEGKPLKGLVFTNETGGPQDIRNLATRILAPLVESAELEHCTLYTFRHTSNSMLLSSGVSTVTLAARLGHTSPRLVETTYATVLVRSKQDAAKRMGEVFVSMRRQPTRAKA